MRQSVIVVSLVTVLTIVLTGGSRAQSLSNADIERRIIEARQIGYDDGHAKGYSKGFQEGLRASLRPRPGGGGTTDRVVDVILKATPKTASGTTWKERETLFLHFEPSGPVGLTLKNEQNQPETRIKRFTWDELVPLLLDRSIGTIDQTTTPAERKLIEEAIKAAPKAAVK